MVYRTVTMPSQSSWSELCDELMNFNFRPTSPYEPARQSFVLAISHGNKTDDRSVGHPLPLSLPHTNTKRRVIAKLLIGQSKVAADRFRSNFESILTMSSSPVPTGPRLFSTSSAADVRAPHLRQRNDSTSSNAADDQLVLGSAREGPRGSIH